MRDNVGGEDEQQGENENGKELFGPHPVFIQMFTPLPCIKKQSENAVHLSVRPLYKLLLATDHHALTEPPLAQCYNRASVLNSEFTR